MENEYDGILILLIILGCIPIGIFILLDWWSDRQNHWLKDSGRYISPHTGKVYLFKTKKSPKPCFFGRLNGVAVLTDGHKKDKKGLTFTNKSTKKLK